MFPWAIAMLLVSCAAAVNGQSRDPRRVHDPSTPIACGNRYWVFSTGAGLRSHCSSNLVDWIEGPRVFEGRLPWWDAAAPGWDGQLWAPEAIRWERGYRLYYSISVFGKKTSAIGLAENCTLDPAASGYAWIDRGIVVQSGATHEYNTIDPAVFADRDRRSWMVFGSYWSGIKLIELDRETGLRKDPAMAPIALASAPQPATDIEAAYIARLDDWYYLFVNRGQCCRGTNSTYRIVIGRSREPAGPYVDREGRGMLEGGGSPFLDRDARHVGPGHAAVFRHEGEYLLSYHFYDPEAAGRPRLRIVSLHRRPDGWPEAGTERLGGTAESN